jgi:NAD(P)H-hydrate epimerase
MEKYSPDKKFTVMSRDEVRAFDTWAINTIGVPGVVLMENAGRSCAELMIYKLKDVAESKVCIFCGTGNNGGDGYVIARHLINRGIQVVVVVCGDRNKIKGDAKTNLDVLGQMGESIELLNPSDPDIAGHVEHLSTGADIIIDSLFGTGLRGQLSDQYRRLIESMNACNNPVLAVDIPSGLDCDTGQPLGAAIRADWTVTFVAVKKGFVSENAAQYTGEIFIASIGISTS